MSVANGDLLEMLERAWHLVNSAGNGDWEREAPGWHSQAIEWRSAYHELRDRMKGEHEALTARFEHVLREFGHHRLTAEAAAGALLALTDAYAEAFPANYVVHQPGPMTPP